MRIFLHCLGALAAFVLTAALVESLTGAARDRRAAQVELVQLEQQIRWGKWYSGRMDLLEREIRDLVLTNRELGDLMIREGYLDLQRRYPEHRCFQGAEEILPDRDG